ncbi:MAG: MarR family transcriptional regulator [Reichenbachiella sp.]
MGISKDIKQEKFKSEIEKVSINLMFTSNWLTQQHYYIFKPHGITSAQYNVLRILRGQLPRAATVNLVIERMLDRMSNVSRIVDKLVSKELVSRSTNPKDRRAVDVKITDKGLQLLSEIDVTFLEHNKMFNDFTPEECKVVNAFLDRFRGETPD